MRWYHMKSTCSSLYLIRGSRGFLSAGLLSVDFLLFVGCFFLVDFNDVVDDRVEVAEDSCDVSDSVSLLSSFKTHAILMRSSRGLRSLLIGILKSRPILAKRR